MKRFPLTTRRSLIGFGASVAASATLIPGAGFAQSAVAQSGPFPARPLRLLVGFSAGGGADAIARTVAARLAAQLGQNVVVENRPGASSTIAAGVLAESPADGYTLMLADSSLLIAARTMQKTGLDARSSFAPIGAVATAPLAIAVRADSPLRSLEDLAASARRGESPSYATSGIGTVHHLAMELLQVRASIRLNHVPYRGAAQIVPDLLGGQLPIAVLSAAAALGHVKAGRMRVLGLTSPEPFAGAEDWRRIADWIPGFDASPRLFVLAPAGTPAGVVTRLEREVIAAISDTEVVQGLSKQGAVARQRSAAELARDITEELDRWDRLVRDAGIVLG
ncbi:MAG: Bug family tripartite tricarboxylate transporter substrate binding protein [Betaproteobacteria bacterium]